MTTRRSCEEFSEFQRCPWHMRPYYAVKRLLGRRCPQCSNPLGRRITMIRIVQSGIAQGTIRQTFRMQMPYCASCKAAVGWVKGSFRIDLTTERSSNEVS